MLKVTSIKVAAPLPTGREELRPNTETPETFGTPYNTGAGHVQAEVSLTGEPGNPLLLTVENMPFQIAIPANLPQVAELVAALSNNQM
jgi:hypothetical protein